MSDLTLMGLLRWTDQDCYDYLEEKRWPSGPVCPRCGATEPYRIERHSVSKNLVRKLYSCRRCRKQFTATLGTIFQDSKVPLSKWFVAIDMMCTDDRGLSAHQIHREMGVTYKSAWYMCKRIRDALVE
jgi:transposase-like protein